MPQNFSSLYLHVPFCVKKCNYCAFYSLPYSEERAKVFISAILKEIELTRNLPHFIKTIYIGGGTPSCLPINYLERILQALFRSYKISKNIEFTIEVNPGTITQEKINLFKSFGINRISIGAQSFLDSELKFLGRIHNVKDIINTVHIIKNSCIENISLDLIYGIPEQTLNNFKFSLSLATSLEIKHISIYELTLDRGTPLEKKLKNGKINLLNDDAIEEMYLFASEFLEGKGFYKYEISNFAKQKYESLHNMAYWQRKTYLGLGPAAFSYLKGWRFHNPRNISQYLKYLNKNKLPWIRECEIKGIEELKEKIILGLRMKQGITLGNLCLVNFFKELEKLKLTRIDGNKVSLTDRGMLISNEIFAKVLLHIENCPACKQV